MSTLTRKQLGEVRRRTAEALEFNIDTTGWTAPQLNGAIQAIEDWYEDQKPTLNGFINAATAPTVLTARVKKAMVVVFLRAKLDREEGL